MTLTAEVCDTCCRSEEEGERQSIRFVHCAAFKRFRKRYLNVRVREKSVFMFYSSPEQLQLCSPGRARGSRLSFQNYFL